MEHVTHGITLDGVARFVDIATDALSSAREEIDALNVYPVPDGDTGTNMFLTVSAARDALREALASDPGLSLGDGDGRARPCCAPGGARQLRGDPQPDAARLRAPPCRRRDRRQAGRDDRGRHGRGDGGQLRRRRLARRGHDPQRVTRRVRRRAGGGRPRGAHPRRVHRGGRGGARGPRPYAGAARRAGPGRGRRRRRPGAVRRARRGRDDGHRAPADAVVGADRHPPHPGRGSASGRRPHRGRPGLRGDVPPRRRRPARRRPPCDARHARRQPRRGRRRRPVERPRARRRRRRRHRGRDRRRSPAPHPGHPLRRPGRRRPRSAPRPAPAARSSRSPRVRAWPRCSSRRARSS